MRPFPERRPSPPSRLRAALRADDAAAITAVIGGDEDPMAEVVLTNGLRVNSSLNGDAYVEFAGIWFEVRGHTAADPVDLFLALAHGLSSGVPSVGRFSYGPDRADPAEAVFAAIGIRLRDVRGVRLPTQLLLMEGFDSAEDPLLAGLAYGWDANLAAASGPAADSVTRLDDGRRRFEGVVRSFAEAPERAPVELAFATEERFGPGGELLDAAWWPRDVPQQQAAAAR